jgi:hypothetical protein
MMAIFVVRFGKVYVASVNAPLPLDEFTIGTSMHLSLYLQICPRIQLNNEK